MEYRRETPTPQGTRQRMKLHLKKSQLQAAAFVVVAFLAGLSGAWVATESGWIKGSPQTITQNRETIVSQEGEVIAEVAKKVSPSVVSINVTQTSPADFFGRTQQATGAGTGIVVSSDGYVLTNKHVIPQGAKDVEVVLSDGTSYEDVKIIGSDPSNDIAFLKIEGAKNLTAAKLGDSDKVQVGQKVIAVGNALGQFQNTVTQGIISGKGRPLEATDSNGQDAESLNNLLQTDAAINPGNSGGPLVNIAGEVIGVNTAVAQEAQGIGFAIPINDARGLLSGVLEKGRVVKAFLGVQYIMLNPSLAKQLNADLDHGALVYAGNGNPVISGGPADKAGLKRGDIITKVNAQDVNETASLASRLNQFKPGNEVELTVHRDGKDQKIKVVLEEYR